MSGSSSWIQEGPHKHHRIHTLPGHPHRAIPNRLLHPHASMRHSHRTSYPGRDGRTALDPAQASTRSLVVPFQDTHRDNSWWP